MASVDPRIIEAIVNSRLKGRGPDSMQPHNPEWFGYKNYPEIFDGIDQGNYEGYLFQNEPDDRQHLFGKFAQYQGMPQAPDVPSARDIRGLERGDPEMRSRFEDRFGTESRNRADQGVAQNDRNYIPTPRPRPGEAPQAGPDDYIGTMPEPMKPFETPGPVPEEVYGYMPGLRDRVKEQLEGEGPSRDLKRDRLDGSMWDRAMAPFADQPTGNIQDYRMMAIENMIKRGADTNPQEDYNPESLPPMPEMDADELVRKQLEGWRR